MQQQVLRLVVLLLPSTVLSFTVVRSPCQGARLLTKKFAFEETQTKITSFVGDLKENFGPNVLESFQKDSGQAKLLVVLQLTLIVLLVLGSVPLVGGLLEVVSGFGFLLGGGAMILAGVAELGPKNLTPSSTPVPGNELKTNGVFALSRHPMYAGLLLAAIGLAVTTHSFQRILISALLFLLLDFKASKEEDSLNLLHPAYAAYQSTVPKLLPGLSTLFGKGGYLYSPDNDLLADDD